MKNTSKNQNTAPVIVLIRHDLRLIDNPALYYAAQSGPVILLYVYDDKSEQWRKGAASKWWLHHSLVKFQAKIRSLGGELFIQKGDARTALNTLIDKSQANSVFWNRRYEPENIINDKKLKSQLKADGITVNSFNANLLSEPWETLNKQGLPYKVFTAYWRNCLSTINVPEPLPPVNDLSFFKLNNINESPCNIDDLNLLDKHVNWAEGISQTWKPGEDSAQEKWDTFFSTPIEHYKTNRDIPGISGTSRLSPHLAFGEISPRQIWHDINNCKEVSGNADVACYLSEIGWREFSYYLLYHFPHILESSFNSKFDHFRWSDNISDHLTAWQKGQTGYPIIDAGMRELWHTGYMHNRVRMVVASFLCKHLLIHWQEGAKWFWDTLLDADLASNTASWQWVAGCGADASPYFRIFNPTAQGEKFDADGAYTRHWVPELKEVPKKYLYKPWEAPKDVLQAANVRIGETYPHPIVDHKAARELALHHYSELKQLDL